MKATMRKKVIASLSVLILLAGVLCACGVKSNDVAMEANGSDFLGFDTETGQVTGEGTDGKKEEISAEYQTKIVRTAEWYAETRDFERAVTQLEESVLQCGGYVERSEVSGQTMAAQQKNKSTRSASFSLRIPAEIFDSFLNTAGERLNIISSHTTAVDISQTYYDTEARIGVLETERLVLEELLAKASSVRDMMEIEERLYDVIDEIESYRTMLAVYDSKTAYATVSLTLYEVSDLTVASETFGARFWRAVGESWENTAEFGKDAAIAAVYAFPVILALAVIGVLTLVIVKKVKKKKKVRADGSSEQMKKE